MEDVVLLHGINKAILEKTTNNYPNGIISTLGCGKNTQVIHRNRFPWFGRYGEGMIEVLFPICWFALITKGTTAYKFFNLTGQRWPKEMSSQIQSGFYGAKMTTTRRGTGLSNKYEIVFRLQNT